MVAAPCEATAPVPPPAYHRAQAQCGPALHLDALTLIGRLHRLAVCRLAVRLARPPCAPPLPAGAGGRPRGHPGGGPLVPAPPRPPWGPSYPDLPDLLGGRPPPARAGGLAPRPPRP